MPNFSPTRPKYIMFTKQILFCMMENITVNEVNVAKTTLWQSNVSNLIKCKYLHNHWLQSETVDKLLVFAETLLKVFNISPREFF